MFDAWPNEQALQNELLARYGLETTRIRWHRGGRPRIVYPRTPETFKNDELLGGVEAVDIYTPVLVVARDTAVPVLLGAGDELLVEPGDLPVRGYTGTPPLMAAWRGEAGGAVLLAGGSLLGDSSTNQFGNTYSGADGPAAGGEHRPVPASERHLLIPARGAPCSIGAP